MNYEFEGSRRYAVTAGAVSFAICVLTLVGGPDPGTLIFGLLFAYSALVVLRGPKVLLNRSDDGRWETTIVAARKRTTREAAIAVHDSGWPEDLPEKVIEPPVLTFMFEHRRPLTYRMGFRGKSVSEVRSEIARLLDLP